MTQSGNVSIICYIKMPSSSVAVHLLATRVDPFKKKVVCTICKNEETKIYIQVHRVVVLKNQCFTVVDFANGDNLTCLFSPISLYIHTNI